MKLRATLRGTRNYYRQMEKRKRKMLAREVRKQLKAGLVPVRAEARSAVAVDTGGTKRAIAARSRVARTALARASVGIYRKARPEAYNAGFRLEFGTRRQTATPFLVPSFERHKPRIISHLEGYVKRSMR